MAKRGCLGNDGGEGLPAAARSAEHGRGRRQDPDNEPVPHSRGDREARSELPVLTVAQVFELADAMPDRRFRTLILVTAFASLRRGEVTALRRQDVAPDGSTVRVAIAHTEVKGRGLVVGPPKSRASVRTVAIPAAIRAELSPTWPSSSTLAPTPWCPPACRVGRCAGGRGVSG